MISSITTFTTLDYPDHLAAIIWFAGCNMYCPYCYNPHIVTEKGTITEETVISFLEKRKNTLDAIVLSGGEATLYKNIISFSQKVKELGYKIKLDTNGINPLVLEELLKNNLIDYVAIDFKAPQAKFKEITNTDKYEKLIESIKILIESKIDFEVRTTTHTDLMNEKDIEEISRVLSSLKYNGIYYIQNFLEGTDTLGNIKNQKKKINREEIKSEVKIKYRNF